MHTILRIYDYLHAHTRVLWTLLATLTLLLVVSVCRLNYNEDISDFLPLETSDRVAFDVFQSISGADRLVVLFDNPDDADLTVQAIDHFAECLHASDTLGWCDGLTTQFDMSQIVDVMEFVYEDIPYFLTPADYARMDSVLAEPDYLKEQLARDRVMLLSPMSSVTTSVVSHDPLGLFAPAMSSLQQANLQSSFELYDGYIFTPDMSRAIAMLNSPFGNSETEHNTQLLALLDDAIADMQAQYPTVGAHVMGGPEIAVGNAHRIKTDSIIAIAISAVLIILLLVYSFGSLRNILLILFSISWGWLFALGGMALFSSHVSIIVIGLSSVILGIAVNYPLHLIAHTAHQPDMRGAIKDIVKPLVVGNITTVAAFLALVPLQSTALRDLGLFASLLLVGTILFVLLFLPHFVKVRAMVEKQSPLLERMAQFSPDKSRPFVTFAVVITLVLTFFSFGTEFDSNVANINYMTPQQREDMQYFQSLLAKDSTRTAKTLYVLASGETYEEAMQQNAAQAPVLADLHRQGLIQDYKDVSRFLVSKDEQQQRLLRWQDFVVRHHEQLTDGLIQEGIRADFTAGAFADFVDFVNAADSFEPQEFDHFAPLTQHVFSQNLTQLESNGRCYVINALNVEPEHFATVKDRFAESFDTESMNSALSNNLSDNFNYIGWACSLIVFFFLWLSFGRFWLAVISFLPMAISWLWILGIMTVFGIKFNIVNIILATFIFGQGDDYTIFMTEGCMYEAIHKRPILASYKKSILQSALIMFIGIGTLIVAQHPAMHSLAQVTIIGMFSVVLMAYMIPPLLFHLLQKTKFFKI